MVRSRQAKVRTEKILQPNLKIRLDGIYARRRIHLALYRPLFLAITDKRPLVRLAPDLDPGPFELKNVDKGFIDVRIFGHKVQPKVQGKCRRVENMRGGLGKDYTSAPGPEVPSKARLAVDCVFHCGRSQLERPRSIFK